MYLLSCLFNLCFISYKQFHFFVYGIGSYCNIKS